VQLESTEGEQTIGSLHIYTYLWSSRFVAKFSQTHLFMSETRCWRLSK